MQGQQVEVNGCPAVIVDLPFLLREFPEGQGPAASAAALKPADTPEDRFVCHVDPLARGLYVMAILVITGRVADAVVRQRSSACNKCRNGLLHGKVRRNSNRPSHSLWAVVFHHAPTKQDTTGILLSSVSVQAKCWMLHATYHRHSSVLHSICISVSLRDLVHTLK